jgi:VWFA-related protein
MSLLALLITLATATTSAASQTSARITLNVVAFDNHDQIVGDLTSQDFQVSDQGKPQRIVSFHRNTDPQAVVILADGGFGTEEIKALEHLKLIDSLYLYLLTDELKPVRGLPSAQKHNPPEKIPWTEHIKPLLEAAIGSPSGRRVVDRAGTSFTAIETLGAALKPFPGRKNLIWITIGVPLSSSPGRARSIESVGRDGFDNSSLINRIATALDHDGVTLSSVHQGNNVENGDVATLEQFADLTGGKVYQNDFEKAINEVMAASQSGYVIEYDVPRFDGKYHKLRVTSSRKGVHLQVKQGYYAN